MCINYMPDPRDYFVGYSSYSLQGYFFCKQYTLTGNLKINLHVILHFYNALIVLGITLKMACLDGLAIQGK